MKRGIWIVILGLCVIAVLFGLWKRSAKPPRVMPPEMPPLSAPVEQPATPPREKPPLPSPKKSIPVKSVTPAPAKPTPEIVPSLPPPSAPPPPVFVPPPPPPPPQEWQGKDTSITHEGQVVIRNDRQWVKFWSEHHPHEAAPEVDFTRDMVVGVFSGPRPADPFAIAILGTREASKTLFVDYREILPPTGTLAVGVTVYPYHLKVIPRTTLPVKFKILETKR